MLKIARLILPLGLIGCGAEPPPPSPYKIVGDIQSTMEHVLEPAAEVIWDSAGSIITLEGEQQLAPTTEEGWLKVRRSAQVVAETGNLLMMPGRTLPGSDWMEISSGLITMGEKAMAAAEEEDPDALFAAGGELYNICVSCHQIYWSGQSRYIGAVNGLPAP